MTSLLIRIKHHCPQLWRLVERVNGRLFALRYPTLPRRAAAILAEGAHEAFDFALVTPDGVAALSDFLSGQPAARLACFDPHGFDRATLERLVRSRAFVLMQATSRADGRLAGYFFLRGFFIGKAFHGLLVDERCAGCGLGTAMWRVSARICAAAGLRMFATVSRQHAASLTSARRGTAVTVVGELANDYLLLACKPKTEEDEVVV